MKRNCLLSFSPLVLAALVAAMPAMGDVIFDNGAPVDSGVPSDLEPLGDLTDLEMPIVLADDFAFAAPVLLQDVHWWGAYWVPPSDTSIPASDDFRLELYAQNGNHPLEDPFVTIALGDVGRTDTGEVDVLGNAIYAYSVDLDDGIVLPSLTTFYISIVNNTATTDAIWAWSASDNLMNNDGLHEFGYFLRNDPDMPWAGSVVPGNLAFNLTGTVIPEPATLSLFGIGLGSLAIRRYRSTTKKT
jgi:hypothetical protein